MENKTPIRTWNKMFPNEKIEKTNNWKTMVAGIYNKAKEEIDHNKLHIIE
jgi:hypothetical protein